jgi:hypothetical protein
MDWFNGYRLIGGQAVEHSDGFIFGSDDRWSLKYSDEKGIVTVVCDDASITTMVETATMRRWTKDMSPIRLSDEEISVITERIKAGWRLYSSTNMRIVSKPTEHAAPPPRVLTWSLYGGKRRPILIP